MEYYDYYDCCYDDFCVYGKKSNKIVLRENKRQKHTHKIYYLSSSFCIQMCVIHVLILAFAHLNVRFLGWSLHCGMPSIPVDSQ